MGLARAAVTYLMKEGKRRPFSGKVLTLGVQHVFMTEAEIERLAAKVGFTLSAPPAERTQTSQIEGHATSEYLFHRLGFDELVTTDFSDFEGANLLFDLNKPEIPVEHIGRYDLVVDSGTLEHVFHLPNALKNVLDFARIGGRVFHFAPSSNHMDHGFYMFSPTLFWDFYAANDVDVTDFDLFRYSMPDHDRASWLFGKYYPGALQKFSMGGLGGGCYGLAVIAEKNKPVTTLMIPQQGAYVSAWRGAVTGTVRPKKSAPRRVLREFERFIARLLGPLTPSWLSLRVKSAMADFPLPVKMKL